jgi:cyclopropane fatty-acyl-phospholipid synthase-like methyltransferase
MVKNTDGNTQDSASDPKERELSLLVKAISRHIGKKVRLVLDYGCGGGRLAKRILEKNKSIELIGVTDSPQQLSSALAFVNNERFEALLPQELTRQVDLMYCMNILNHIPAVELRETLHRMHHFVKPGGEIIIFAENTRKALRFDKPDFVDDRFLGVNLRNEIQRFFEPKSALFTEVEITEHPGTELRATTTNDSDPKAHWLLHYALVYSRRELEGPIFNLPYRS